MARVACPHGHKRVARLGALVIEQRTVEILDGICDSCDLCGLAHCEYFDESREATRRFQKAQALLHGDPRWHEQDEHYGRMLREKHRVLYGAKAS